MIPAIKYKEIEFKNILVISVLNLIILRWKTLRHREIELSQRYSISLLRQDTGLLALKPWPFPLRYPTFPFLKFFPK